MEVRLVLWSRERPAARHEVETVLGAWRRAEGLSGD